MKTMLLDKLLKKYREKIPGNRKPGIYYSFEALTEVMSVKGAEMFKENEYLQKPVCYNCCACVKDNDGKRYYLTAVVDVQIANPGEFPDLSHIGELLKR